MILGAKDYMKIRGSLALRLCLCLVAIAAVAAPATTPTLSASPSAVDFQYNPPEPAPLPVNVTVTASDGSSPALTVAVTPGTGTPATLFPNPVVSGDTLQVYFNNATFDSLGPGIYNATITVSAAGFANLTIRDHHRERGRFRQLDHPGHVEYRRRPIDPPFAHDANLQRIRPDRPNHRALRQRRRFDQLLASLEHKRGRKLVERDGQRELYSGNSHRHD